ERLKKLGVELVPHFLVQKKNPVDAGQKSTFVRRDIPDDGITQSFRAFKPNDNEIAVTKTKIGKVVESVLFKLSAKDNPVLVGVDTQRTEVQHLLNALIHKGESNSALVFGPRYGGKSALLRSVLATARDSMAVPASSRSAPFYEIWLNGLFQTDDKQAVKEIARQLHVNLEEEYVGAKSIAECLGQILFTLQSGSKENVPVVFVIKEFDLFAAHTKQSLLYNLFDVAQMCGSPILVMGLTTRMDAVNLLEKRVKSRFSHRAIFMQRSRSADDYKLILENLLILPSQPDEDPFVTEFNSAAKGTIATKEVIQLLERLHDLRDDLSVLHKIIAFENLSRIELVKPQDGAASRCPAEYRMHKFTLSNEEVFDMLEMSSDCPDLVKKWAAQL
ncbi:origin recognition complex subunit 4, partial [Cladochytrium tenue]